MEHGNAAKQFFRKYGLNLALICLIFLLAGYAGYLRNTLKGDERIVGTFNTIEGPNNAKGEYLVFQQNDIYCIYRQGEKISEEGVYQKREEYITLNWGGEQRCLVQDKITGKLYDLSGKEPKTYYKIGDMPAFIGVLGEIPPTE